MKGVGRLHGVSSVLLCLTAVFYGHLQGHGASASKVTLTNNGYQHVVVAISPNIGQQDKNTIISSLRVSTRVLYIFNTMVL